jgi:hypothetical protein
LEQKGVVVLKYRIQKKADAFEDGGAEVG